MVNSRLSLKAQQMLQAGKKVESVNDRDTIKNLFIDKGLPIFPKVIELQELYGGIWYRIGPKFYEGFSIDIFYYSDFKNKYDFHYYKKEGEKYFFQCMDYHYAGDIGPCIDEDGKIYNFSMGRYFIRAESIEEFLEDEAIRFSIAESNIKTGWLTRGATRKEVLDFHNYIKLTRVENEAFTNKHFEWWSDLSQDVFIRINLLSEYNQALVYCKNKEVLFNLYRESKAVSSFPKSY